MKNIAVHSDPIDAHSRLAELGLTEDLLLQPVLRGLAEARSRTDNHPPMYRGLTPWGEATCALRESLSPLGWVRSDEENLPLTAKRAVTLAIIMVSGEHNTAYSPVSPCA